MPVMSVEFSLEPPLFGINPRESYTFLPTTATLVAPKRREQQAQSLNAVLPPGQPTLWAGFFEHELEIRMNGIFGDTTPILLP